MSPLVPEIRPIASREHELVVYCSLDRIGYRAFIAVHSTRAGPAVGGIRLRDYPGRRPALADALRLSRAMTLKCALAGVPLGGGKSVIFPLPGHGSRAALYQAHGLAIASLEGRYIGAPDLGTTPDDLVAVRSATRHVAGLPGGIGDPGPFTARGVRRAMEAAAEIRWGRPDLSGRTIAVQGVGSVGEALCATLSEAGARLIVADADRDRARRVASRFDAREVPASRITAQPADIFAPCAVGGILDSATVAGLRVAIVCGAANNQLPDGQRGQSMARRDILYVPDFLANAGGVLSGCADLLGWTPETVADRIDRIYRTALAVLDRSRRDGRLPASVAVRTAEECLAGLPAA